MKILFFILLFSLNLNSNIFIKCKNITKKYIFFDLENNKELLIIKDIFIKQYNKNFNFLIDTMGFISGIFLSKELRYDFMVGDICSPMNSYRTFEGHISDLNFNINYNHKKFYNNFPIAIFKVYNRIKFYEKNIKFNGVMGLALNFTEEVLLDERYFFGESNKYSIMNYFKNELNIIDKNQFSIYQNKFILGEIDINLKMNYCNCGKNIDNSFIYFFWNCNIKSIVLNDKYLNNYYKDIKISILFDSLLKDNILSTNTKIANILLNQIKDELNTNKNICNITKSYIYCMNDYYNEIFNMNLKIRLENEIYIEIPFNLNIKNKTEKYFYLNIDVNDFNIDKNQNIIKIGNEIFKSYFVTFDAENKRIGLKKLENIKLSFLFGKNNYYTNIFQKNKLDNYKLFLLKILFIIIIISSVFGILLLFYSKNNFSEVYNL